MYDVAPFREFTIKGFNMPLGKSVSKNIKELYADNKKPAKAKGANGKPRARNQIVAISMKAAGKSMQKKMGFKTK